MVSCLPLAGAGVAAASWGAARAGAGGAAGAADESLACSCFFSSPQPASAKQSAIARPLAVNVKLVFTRSSIYFRSPLDVPVTGFIPLRSRADGTEAGIDLERIERAAIL